MEITESVALHDLDNTRRFIDQVRNFGVKIALDDFGAGYTSFSYLKELPADVLKIDGNFIVNINAHPANVAIVEAIVNLAVNLGMKTIAEWAEDTATVRTLAEIGVDYVQGFAVSRSQAPDRMLTAASSASFIQNEELALLVRTLGAPANVAEAGRLGPPARPALIAGAGPRDQAAARFNSGQPRADDASIADASSSTCMLMRAAFKVSTSRASTTAA